MQERALEKKKKCMHTLLLLCPSPRWISELPGLCEQAEVRPVWRQGRSLCVCAQTLPSLRVPLALSLLLSLSLSLWSLQYGSEGIPLLCWGGAGPRPSGPVVRRVLGESREPVLQ